MNNNKEYINLLISGDQGAFKKLVDDFGKQVFNTCLNYIHNNEEAEEVTQDVFVEVFRSINKFQEKSSLSTWIYRISINKSLDFIKSKNRKKRFAFMSSLFNTSGTLQHDSPNFFHPGVILENKEKSDILFKAIDTLPENQKTAFILSKIEGLSYAEIAEVMQSSISSIESLLFRAKQNLQKELSNFYKS